MSVGEFSRYADGRDFHPHIGDVARCLTSLSPRHGVAFALACAERSFVFYEIASRCNRNLAPALGRKLLDDHWKEILSGGISPAARFDVKSEIIEALLPESFDGTVYEYAVGSFPNSILSISLALQTGDLEHLTACARYGLRRIYFYIDFVSSEEKAVLSELDGYVLARLVERSVLWKREIEMQINDLCDVRRLDLRVFHSETKLRETPLTPLLRLLSQKA